MLAGAYILYRSSWLSAASALGLMGINGLAVSLWLVVRLRVTFPPLRGELIRDSCEKHWRYTRWSMANQTLNWVPINISYLALPLFAGFTAGASFRTLVNLIRPMQQGVWTLSNLVLPALVWARDRGRAEFNSRLRFRPDWQFLAYGLPALVALTLGTWLMYLWGTAGAEIGLLLSQVVTAILATVSYRRSALSSETPKKQDASPERRAAV